VIRYSIVFILGICFSFIVPIDVFNNSSLFVNIFYRISWGLFFVFVIWLVQPVDSKEKVKEE